MATHAHTIVFVCVRVLRQFLGCWMRPCHCVTLACILTGVDMCCRKPRLCSRATFYLEVKFAGLSLHFVGVMTCLAGVYASCVVQHTGGACGANDNFFAHTCSSCLTQAVYFSDRQVVACPACITCFKHAIILCVLMARLPWEVCAVRWQPHSCMAGVGCSAVALLFHCCKCVGYWSACNTAASVTYVHLF